MILRWFPLRVACLLWVAGVSLLLLFAAFQFHIVHADPVARPKRRQHLRPGDGQPAAPLAGIEVRFNAVGVLGIPWSLVTDATGNYRASPLDAGLYRVEFRATRNSATPSSSTRPKRSGRMPI